MQNILEKVSQTKGKLLLGLSGAAIVGLFGYLYRQYKNQNTEQEISSQQPSTQPFDLNKEIQKFKTNINLINPSLEQVKAIIEFSFDMTYKQIDRIHNDFKKSRRIIKSQENLKQYFKTVGIGMIRLRQIATNLQQSIMAKIGCNPQVFITYQNELNPFIQEQQAKRLFGNEKATLNQIKTVINTQINFLQQNGNELVSKIVEYCKDWQIQAKKYIPDVFTIYMTDQIAQRYPEVDSYDMRGAEKRFEKYLVNETRMMKSQMRPLISRLINELGMYQVRPENSN